MKTILDILQEGFREYEIPYAVTAKIEGFASVIRFHGADEGDCLLLAIIIERTIDIRRITGGCITRRLYNYKDICDDFFIVLKNDYEIVVRYIAANRSNAAQTLPKGSRSLGLSSQDSTFAALPDPSDHRSSPPRGPSSSHTG